MTEAAPGGAQAAPLLSIRGLTVDFDTPAGTLRAVDGVSLDIARGGTLGVVGESGCGKSVTAMSVLRLIPDPPGRIASGSVFFDGADVAALTPPELRRLRGGAVGMVFQDPMTALSPLKKIGDQLLETVRLHRRATRREALGLAADWLSRCGLRDPARVLSEYPFRLSGGQQQRVMIASALMNGPGLLIADEPTTALDAAVRAQILDLMRNAKGDGAALMLITHDIGVVRRCCPSVAVMYAGEIVEQGASADILRAPRHPYTRALLEALPSASRPGARLAAIPGAVPSPLAYPPGCRFAPRCAFAKAECRAVRPAPADGVRCHFPGVADGAPRAWQGHDIATRAGAAQAEQAARRAVRAAPLLEVADIVKRFKRVRAVDGVSLALFPGETLAIVGESGCGKTTLARIIAGLEAADSGVMRLGGAALGARRPPAQRRAIQMVFQDPFSSLNPRMRIGAAITEGAAAHGIISKRGRAAAARALLESVGLPPDAAERFPHEFSGGQRQRIAIARAIAMRPAVLVCDEPVSALDVSVQAQALNLLSDLQRGGDLATIFITHDMAVAAHVSDRVAVMHEGRIVETGAASQVFANPRAAQTRALLDADAGAPP